MKISGTAIQFTTVLDNVIFPIEQMSTVKLLAAAGFQPARPGALLPNNIVVQQGDLAIKNNTILSMNSQTMSIGVIGTTNHEVLQTITEVATLLSKEGVDIDKNGKFHEMLTDYVVETGKDPAKIIQKYFKSIPVYEQFDKIFQSKPPSLFSIRILPKDAIIDSAEFYDLRIEPTVHKPHSSYLCRLVFRSKDRKKTEKMILELEKKVQSVIQIIEKEN